jgi:hypothetical protein
MSAENQATRLLYSSRIYSNSCKCETSFSEDCQSFGTGEHQKQGPGPIEIERIQVLFFDVSLEDTEILQVLKREGDEISKHTLVRLRFELGLRRRVRGEEQCQAADALVQRLVEEELGKGVIDGYGRGYLYTHFQTAWPCYCK